MSRLKKTSLRPQTLKAFEPTQQRVIDNIYDLMEKNDLKAQEATDTANRAGRLAAASSGRAIVDDSLKYKIVSVFGEVDSSWRGNPNDFPIAVRITLSDLEIFFGDKTKKVFANTVLLDIPFNPFSDLLFEWNVYYNFSTQLIEYLDVALIREPANADYLDSTKYAKLFSVSLPEEAMPRATPIPFSTPAPKVRYDFPDYSSGLFNQELGAVDANLEEIITAFKNSVIGVLGANVSEETSTLSLSSELPLRVDLPQGSRVLLISGEEYYFLEVSAKASSGATSISIKPQFIDAYRGAKIVHDLASQQAQLQVSPRKVKIIAENAASNASSALTLATTANSAVAGLQSQIDGIDTSGIATIEASVTAIEGEVDTLQATTVMKASVGAGNVASITVEAMNGANPISAVKIAGANIDLAGLVSIWNTDNTSATEIDGNKIKTGTVTTNQLDASVVNAAAAVVVANTSFIADVANAVSNTTFSGVTVYKGATEPTGGTYLQGDIWLDTTQVNGTPRNLPYVYDGSNWIRQFAILTDGDFQVGTINANKIAGDDLSSIRSTTGFLTVNDRIIVGSGGFIRGNSYSPASVGVVGSAGFYLGSDAADSNIYKFAVGNGAKYFYYDGTDVKFKGGVIEGVASAETKLDGDINMLNTSKIYIGSDLEISKDRIKYKSVQMSDTGLIFGTSGFPTRFDAVGKIILNTWTELDRTGYLQLGNSTNNVGQLSMIGNVFTFSNQVQAQKYRSQDGSVGGSKTITFTDQSLATHTLVYKDGIFISHSVTQ